MLSIHLPGSGAGGGAPRTGGEGEEVSMCRPYTLGQLGTVSGIPRNWLGHWKYRRTSQNKIFAQQGSAGLVRSPLIGPRRETDQSSAGQQRRALEV